MATKKNTGEKTFIKRGGGSLRLKDGRTIKPNEKFNARLELIPMSFRDSIEEVQPRARASKSASEEESQAEADAQKEEYTVEARQNAPGFYDVKDSSGKLLNEKALRKEDADALKEDLEKK